MLEFEKIFILTIIVIFFLQNGHNLKKSRKKKIQTSFHFFLKKNLSTLQKGADSRMIMTHRQMKLCSKEVRKIFY